MGQIGYQGHRQSARLTPAAQKRLQTTMAKLGSYKAASVLGCSWTLIEKISDGGVATKPSIDRITEKLDAMFCPDCEAFTYPTLGPCGPCLDRAVAMLPPMRRR